MTPPPIPHPVFTPPVTGGCGSFVNSGSCRSLSLVLRVARGSSRKSGSALGTMMVLFADPRKAADPVGARDRRRSERPSDWRMVRDVGMSAPLVERVGSYKT